MKTSVLFILGPTGVGKSDIAVQLALSFHGEIVNADSRQVYRYMDIGTAKPSTSERAKVPHHLYDILTPDQPFSLAQFLDLAHTAIADIHKRGKLPILVGGTGQYLTALVLGWKAPPVPPDAALRSQLETEVIEKGGEHLYKRLQQIDPESAARIDPRNVRRVIRALEIYHHTGVLPSRLRGAMPPDFKSLVIGLTMPREELYKRIDERVDYMVQQGLVDEVKNLLAMGYSPDLPVMSSIGYKEILMHLRGELTVDEAAQLIKHETHRLVRHQYTWFKRSKLASLIHWLEAGPSALNEAKSLVEQFLNQRSFPSAQ